MDEPEIDWTNLTEIADEWGLTNRALGDSLRNAGYREDGKPTTKALEESLATTIWSGDWPRHYWSKRAVGEFLQKSGRKKGRAWEQEDGKPRYIVLPIIIS
jgi:hypothetical protein